MDQDLAYYRRRLAEEQTAEHSATHPAVRAAHHELADGYAMRIAALEQCSGARDLHLVDAA
jgi:hypothetical protein